MVFEIVLYRQFDLQREIDSTKIYLNSSIITMMAVVLMNKQAKVEICIASDITLKY